MRRQIAVIGSGVAGLTAAYILQRDADVTLYESDNRLGGHAHTHDLVDDAGRTLGIDTGFIVHNERTYPQLLRLFRELEVVTQESEMSMSISCGGCGLEYAGSHGLSGLFPTVGNLARPKYLYLLTEVLRFYRLAHKSLAAGEDSPGAASGGAHSETMAAFLDRGRFSRYFRSHFITPVISAVWSCSPALALQYPSRYLFQFLDNHGLLSIGGSPTWRTVVGGSGRYVERAAKQLNAVHTSNAVRAVTQTATGIEVRDEADDVCSYDATVIATHPHQALSMLVNASPLQTELLGAIDYSPNPTVLHTDVSVLPAAAKAHASWNYRLPACNSASSAVHVTYDMNRLQRLDTDTRYLVTLNGGDSIADSAVLDRMAYEHPIFTPASVHAQSRLGEISNGVLAFAGAYHGWGFHEDGCRSGVQAAARLGVQW